MKITNKKNLPRALIAAIESKGYDSGGSDLTASQVCAPPQQVWLKKKYANHLEEDASDRLWALFGEAMHYILEQGAGHGELVEKRLFGFVNIEGKAFKVSGQVDNLDLFDGILTDYKTVSVWSLKSGAKEDWIVQLNVLGWLARVNGYTVTKLQIVALARDWRPGEKFLYPDYPDKVETFDLPLWTDAEVTERLKRALGEQIASEPRHCTEEERWVRDKKVAVMKRGRKSAVKLCGTTEEALNYLMGIDTPGAYYTVERPGRAIRCESYCVVKDFCTQYNKEKENGV